MEKKTEKPIVSVGMPVYNGEKYIVKLLDSLLSQTFKNIEIIISDNASTDDTGRIIKEYSKKDRRVTCFSQKENIGIVANYNFVLKKARGEYFLWSACDDYWDETAIEKFVSVLENNPDVSLVSSYKKLINLINKREINLLKPVPSISDNSFKNIITRFRSSYPALFYGLFRRKDLNILVEKFDFFDMYFGFYMALKGKIFIIKDVLFFAGMKEGSIRTIKVYYSGNRIYYFPFLRKTITLFYNSELKLIEKILIIPLFFIYWLKTIRTTKKTIKFLRKNNYKAIETGP
jgi:glycosyltransferase involved in cell wall biosynthesis